MSAQPSLDDIKQLYGPRSVPYNPDQPLVVAREFGLLQHHAGAYPEGSAIVVAGLSELDGLQGAAAGRQRVFLLDGGDKHWRKEAV